MGGPPDAAERHPAAGGRSQSGALTDAAEATESAEVAEAGPEEDGPRGWDVVRELPRMHLLAAGVAAAVLSIACVVRFGFDGRALVGAVFASTLALLTATDLDRRLIPNVVVLPATALVLALQIAFFSDQTLEWVLASLAAALFFFLPLLIVPTGMGMGDVKLAALIGAVLGTSAVLGIFVGLVAGAAVAIAILVREGLSARKKAIAFGPYLAFGGLVALFLGGHWET